VGAPYEGNGAVYIFRGSPRGLIADYSQRIAASDFAGVQLGAFGASLAGGADLDNNGYPDLAVGAFASDTLVVLRARPVVNIETEMTTVPQLIDPQQKTCPKDGSANICFELKVCFRFTAEPRER
jgi:Integrin alpha/FG-GAP repeat